MSTTISQIEEAADNTHALLDMMIRDRLVALHACESELDFYVYYTYDVQDSRWESLSGAIKQELIAELDRRIELQQAEKKELAIA